MTDARRHLQRWGAVWILAVLWIGFGVGQWFSNLAEYTSDQAAHGLPFRWSEFLPYFWARFFENHASESWQLAAQAVLIVGLAPLLFRRGEEDRERLEAKVDRLTALVTDLLGGSTIVEAQVDRILELHQSQQQTTRRRRPPRLLPSRGSDA